MQVLARSEEIFRSNAEKRRRRSADDSTANRTPEGHSAGKAAKLRAAGGGGAGTTGRDGRPTTSPAACNDNAQPRRKLSAYIRGIKESSPPALNSSSNDGNTTAGQEAANDRDKARIANLDKAAVEGAPAVVQGSERRASAVTAAAKRVAIRKRKEKAEKDARIRVGEDLEKAVAYIHIHIQTSCTCVHTNLTTERDRWTTPPGRGFNVSALRCNEVQYPTSTAPLTRRPRVHCSRTYTTGGGGQERIEASLRRKPASNIRNSVSFFHKGRGGLYGWQESRPPKKVGAGFLSA